MSNYIFIEHNIDISKILQQVLDHPENWNEVSTYANIGGKTAPSGFLPLVMGVLKEPYTDIRHSEFQQPTTLYPVYTEVRKWLRSYGIKQTARAAFFRLPPGGEVPRHIDDGDYYLSRDRYHLSLQGEYRYEVDGEEHIIKPGTFFWFDNKKMHSSKNISNVDRISFVFDVIHSKHNPQHAVRVH